MKIILPGLYIVSTPIGNLDDITIRAIEVLKQSDYILAESSARTSKLLHEYDIKKKIVTFNKANEKRIKLFKGKTGITIGRFFINY